MKCTLFVLLMLANQVMAQYPTIEVSKAKATFVRIKGTTPQMANLGDTSGAVEVQRLGKTNVLRLQAYDANFHPTNLVVVCADTTFYAELRYSENPKIWDHTFSYAPGTLQTTAAAEPSTTNSTPAQAENTGSPATTKLKAAGQIRKFKALDRDIHLSALQNKLLLFLDNISVDQEGRMYFKIRVRNNSKINYNIESVNFQVRPKKKTFTASAVQSHNPAFTEDYSNPAVVAAGSEETLIYVMQKFALTEDEILNIAIGEAGENSAGRQLQLKVHASTFNKVTSL